MLEGHDLPSGSEDPPRRPRSDQQERFDVLMGAFNAELCRNMEGIADEFPTVGRALKELTAYLVRHPDTGFRRVRPEILQETVRAGERVCPR